MGLSQKQYSWLEHYLRTWNATDSARAAGYKDPEQSGWENKQKLEIQEAIQARLDELHMSANEVLARLTDHARGSLSDFLRIAPNGALEGFDLSEDKPLHLLRKASLTSRTFKGITEETVTIELYDAQAALVHLGKHHKLFTDNVNLSGEVTTKGYTTKEASPDAWDEKDGE